MKVRIQQKGLLPPVIIEDAQSVVVYDEYDNPVYALQQVNKDTAIGERGDSPNFAKFLRAIGVGLNSICKAAKLR